MSIDMSVDVVHDPSPGLTDFSYLVTGRRDEGVLSANLNYTRTPYTFFTDYSDVFDEVDLRRIAQNFVPDSYFYVGNQRYFHDAAKNVVLKVFDPVQPVICPHPKAPLFAGTDRNDILAQLQTELTSDSLAITPTIIDYLFQACLVNLWWYLKFVSSDNGPYRELTDHLHVDMANFAQGTLEAGAKSAAFLYRSAYKSSIFTHGFNQWLIIRRPDIAILLVVGVADRGEEFLNITQKAFEDNKLLRVIAPAYMAKKNIYGTVTEKNWTKKNFISPARTRHKPQPTLKYVTVGSASAGNHGDHLSVDDIVGDDMLTADQIASADMIKSGQWFKANQRTLLVTPGVSTISLGATRYAINDPYEEIMASTKTVCSSNWIGSQKYAPNPSHEWRTYYRTPIEGDVLTFPEKLTKLDLARIAQDDLWTYALQYVNNVHGGILNELSDYEIREFVLEWIHDEVYLIPYAGKRINLKTCDVVLAVDPGASKKKVSNKTSRSAVGVVARDEEDRDFILDIIEGYLSTSQLFDALFSLHKKWRKYIRASYFEMQGPFKVLEDPLREEKLRRNYFLSILPQTKSTDKVIAIRSTIQPKLKKGQLYVTAKDKLKVQNELYSFPSGTKDVLDMLELGCRKLLIPEKFLTDPDDDEDDDLDDETSSYHHKHAVGANSTTGY